MIKKLRLLLTAILIASCDCSGSKTIEYKYCGLPCYPGDPDTLNVGVCKPGYYFCDVETGSDPVCVNYTLPSEEICDNIDNDCDGKIDNIKKNCSSACEVGEQLCVGGVWGACDAKQPADEICNGLDDDCDGTVDNPEKLPVQFCYDGPQQSLSYGECRPGIMACINGKYDNCIKQVLPTIEKCNFKDDDCDGIVDNGFSNKEVYNIVLLDISGSMIDYILDIRNAFSMWQTANPNSNQKFILIPIPHPADIRLSIPRVSLQASNISTFNNRLNQTQINNMVAEEAILDAARMIIDPADPLNLNIPENVEKRIIIFSDEEPQSYYNTFRMQPNELGEDFRDAQIPVYLFVIDTKWNVIAALSGGAGFTLQKDSYSLLNNLSMIIIESTCE